MESQNSDDERPTVEDVLEGAIEINEGKMVKQKVKQADYSQREMIVVCHYFENHYHDLYGSGKGANVAYEQSAVWKEFAGAVDRVEEGKNERTVKKLWKRIDIMKYRGKTWTDGCAIVTIAFLRMQFCVNLIVNVRRSKRCEI